MTKYILAIDDDPERYESLADLVKPHGIEIVVTHTPTEQDMVGDKFFAVFLDHDMPTVGTVFAEQISVHKPVCVSSANRTGALRIANILRNRGVKFVIMSALDACPEERWLGWVLDHAYRTAPPNTTPLTEYSELCKQSVWKTYTGVEFVMPEYQPYVNLLWEYVQVLRSDLGHPDAELRQSKIGSYEVGMADKMSWFSVTVSDAKPKLYWGCMPKPIGGLDDLRKHLQWHLRTLHSREM